MLQTKHTYKYWHEGSEQAFFSSAIRKNEQWTKQKLYSSPNRLSTALFKIQRRRKQGMPVDGLLEIKEGKA